MADDRSNVYDLTTRKRMERSQEPPDRTETDLFYTGYWGYKIGVWYALFPIKTEDLGWIWLRKYYYFDANTGYDKHAWKWECLGRTLLPSTMWRLKREFFQCKDALDILRWKESRGL